MPKQRKMIDWYGNIEGTHALEPDIDKLEKKRHSLGLLIKFIIQYYAEVTPVHMCGFQGI